MTCLAPRALAARTAHSPTAPSPTTATVRPGPASAATAPNHPVPSTSEAARREARTSSSSGIPPGTGTRVPSARGTRVYWAWVSPMKPPLTQRDWKPEAQISQVLSLVQKEPTTRSPTATPCTWAPTSTTVPTYSWPMGRPPGGNSESIPR